MSWLLPRFHTPHAHRHGFWFCGCAGLPLHGSVMPEGGGGGSGAVQPGRAPVVLVVRLRSFSPSELALISSVVSTLGVYMPRAFM